jgi:hypothetical protein
MSTTERVLAEPIESVGGPYRRNLEGRRRVLDVVIVDVDDRAEVPPLPGTYLELRSEHLPSEVSGPIIALWRTS